MKTTKKLSDFFANVEPTKFAIKANSVWLDLSKFESYEEFEKVLFELFPFQEIYFRGYNGIPKEMYEKFQADWEEAFEDFVLYEDSNAETRLAYERYLRDMDSLGTFNEFTARYVGYFGSEEDFAIQYVEEIGLLDEIDSNIAMYFDYNAYARDLFLNGEFTYCNGYVFSY